MNTSITSSGPSDFHQAASKKRPSPSNDCTDAPTKRRNAPSDLNVQGIPNPPITLQQLMEREMHMLFEVEYQQEVISYMHEMDVRTRPVVETIDLQPELRWYMRPYLIDFLIEIHQQYRLRSETLYLAINIIDRYVAKRVVFKKHYQLVGCAALWIAAKYEDAKERVPTVAELGTMCCGAYEESSFLQMEGHVLSTIGWQLGHPTAEAWLRLFSIGAHRNRDSELETVSVGHVSRFIMEISLFYRAYVGLKASDIAGGALLLSRYILGKPRRASDETDGTLAAARLLDSHLGEHISAISAIVKKKYSHVCYSRASIVVQEWYEQGHRFNGPARIAILPGIISQSADSAPFKPIASSKSSLSISTSCSSICSSQLTTRSLSSLSLNSSPTSSVSSYPSVECHSNSSPSTDSSSDESRDNSLMCSPQLTCTKPRSPAAWSAHKASQMSMNCLTSVEMSREF